jgi:hypothetical protein
MLKRFETLTLLLAALLALLIEGCYVYWIWRRPLGPEAPEPSLLYVGEWTSPTLPQYWLVGALLALFYRFALIVRPSYMLDPEKLARHRRTFVRIWYWFLLLAGAQGCALYFDYFVLVRR